MNCVDGGFCLLKNDKENISVATRKYSSPQCCVSLDSLYNISAEKFVKICS